MLYFLTKVGSERVIPNILYKLVKTLYLVFYDDKKIIIIVIIIIIK